MNGGLIATFLGIAVVFWALFLRPQGKAIESDKDLTTVLPKSCEHTDCGSAFRNYRQALARWHQWAFPALMLLFVLGAGFVLFLWKVYQTSDFALQYSSRAHAEMGEWIVVGIFLIVAMVMLAIPAIPAKRKYFSAKDELRKSLKDALAFTERGDETREKVEIEEMLKKLSSTPQSLAGEFKNRV